MSDIQQDEALNMASEMNDGEMEMGIESAEHKTLLQNMKNEGFMDDPAGDMGKTDKHTMDLTLKTQE